MTDVERLLAIEEIKQLKARYFRGLDTKDWDLYAGVFTEDATIDVRGSTDASEDASQAAIDGFDDEAVITGGEAMAAFVAKITVGTTTAHHGHMPEIDVLSPTTARGIWAMEDRLWQAPGAPARLMHGWGHYHETYEKRDGRWLIASMRITKLRNELT
ncbi:MAG: nuclear transport factor 2 family protein [Sphingomonadales bacterium]